MPRDFGARLAAIGALRDPVRRSLYLHVLTSHDAVGRDAAAAAVGIRRSLAAFHLDRLAREGLVDVEFRRLTGRSGPGAGRPAKLYRRAAREHAIALPPRSYALMADLLADVVEAGAGGGDAAEAVVQRRGEAVGRELRARAGRRAGPARLVLALDGLLADIGYQPSVDGARHRLRNCPFRGLTERHGALVCGLNAAFIRGVVAGGDLSGRLETLVEQTPGECCVVLAPLP